MTSRVASTPAAPDRSRRARAPAAARRTAADTLCESEERLRLALDAACMSTFEWDLVDGRMVWSRGHEALFGFAPGAFDGTFEAFAQCVHPDDLPGVHAAVARSVAMRARCKNEFRVVWPDGSEHWIAGHGDFTFGDSGQPLRMRGVMQDVTEHRRADEALREAEARLRLSVAASNIGLWDWDLRTDHVYFSPEWKGQLGYTDDEIPNRYEEWEHRLHPDDLAPTLAKVRAAIADPAAHYAVEFRLRHKDGSYRWIFTQAQVVRDAGGRGLRMIGCHVDITDRKEAERAAADSRDLLRRLAGRLLAAREAERATIAREIHDQLGQLLTGLKMDVKKCQRRVPTGEAHTMLSDMGIAIDDLIGTVRRIATDLRPGVLDDLGLGAAIEWQTEQFTRRHGIPCHRRVTADASTMGGEVPIALFRILQESLTNVARHAGATAVTVTLEAIGSDLVLEVHDNGCGMSAEDLTSSRSLGIAGIRERATLVGGTSDISSAPGEGATVRVRVPQIAAGVPT